jgi:hypothetical protein
VTHILARLAYPSGRFLDLFGGLDVMIESPVLDEVKEVLRQRYESEGRVKAARESIVSFLEARFGSVTDEVRSGVGGITDPTRLDALVRLAATCPDVKAFAAGLSAG